MLGNLALHQLKLPLKQLLLAAGRSGRTECLALDVRCMGVTLIQNSLLFELSFCIPKLDCELGQSLMVGLLLLCLGFRIHLYHNHSVVHLQDGDLLLLVLLDRLDQLLLCSDGIRVGRTLAHPS